MLYSHDELYICIYLQNHIQHNKDERTQFFRKIYLSLYWKGCVWEWVGDWTKTATYWPPNSLAITVFLSHSPGLLNRGPGGPSLCWDMVLIPASSLQLPDFLSHPGLYHCSTLTQFNPLTAKAISWSPRLDAPVIYTGAFLLLTAWLGRRSICNIYLS